MNASPDAAMKRESPEITQRRLRSSTASTSLLSQTGHSSTAAGRTASPEQSSRRGSRRRRGFHHRPPQQLPEIVDLTDIPDAPSQAYQGPPLKRARTSDNVSSQTSSVVSFEDEDKIEEINLIDVDDAEGLNKLLAKNQEDLLNMQRLDQEKPKLANFKCVICLDDPTDLAATPCGHMFCDFCLRGALRAGQPLNARSGRCPVCRRRVNIKDIVPLEIMKLSKPMGKGKGKAN